MCIRDSNNSVGRSINVSGQSLSNIVSSVKSKVRNGYCKMCIRDRRMEVWHTWHCTKAYRRCWIRRGVDYEDKGTLFKKFWKVLRKKSVSYTHLDVYKRQIGKSGRSIQPGIIEADTISRRDTDTWRRGNQTDLA